MKKVIHIQALLILCCLISYGQTIIIEEVTELPNPVYEASGLELGNEPNTFWSHNDKNNPTEIYQFDTASTLLKTIHINSGFSIVQSDFEDLAKDNDNNLYIGDLGDNKLSRVLYRIYKISTDSTDIDEVPTIEFFYPEFRSYDCESIFWLDGYIYLFIKNPRSPQGLVTQSYRVPDQPGGYEAEFIENFIIPGAYPFPLTAADISPDGSTIILMSKDEFYVLSCFTAPYFFTASAVLKVPFERIDESNRIPQTCLLYTSPSPRDS